MTNGDAIRILKNIDRHITIRDGVRVVSIVGVPDFELSILGKDAIDIAIRELEEIKKYRKIGTVDECIKSDERIKSLEEYNAQLLWEKTIAEEQLKEIGASLGEKMDSVKELIERDNPKDPEIYVFEGDRIEMDGKTYVEVGKSYICPNCGGSVGSAGEYQYRYCPDCGQAIRRITKS